MISVNAKIPKMIVQVVTLEGKKEINTDELFQGKTILFGLPGAFTPTCSQTQLPGFAQQEQALRAKGYENIICMAVNDAFVMQAWKEQVAPDANIIMVTSHGQEDMVRQAIKAGAKGYVMKPVDPDTLTVHIERLLKN